MEPHLVCVGKQIVSTFAVLKNLQKLGKLEKMPKLNHFKCAAYRYFYPGNLLLCIISDKLTILQCIIKWTWTWLQWLFFHYLVFILTVCRSRFEYAQQLCHSFVGDICCDVALSFSLLSCMTMVLSMVWVWTVWSIKMGFDRTLMNTS